MLRLYLLKWLLKNRVADKELYKEFWCDPEATVVQFLGQDNVFFYVIMQGSMWLGHEDNSLQLPQKGDLQMTEIFERFPLDGEWRENE